MARGTGGRKRSEPWHAICEALAAHIVYRLVERIESG